MNAREIFMAALDRESPEERNRYLDEACGDDQELRRRVDALLRAYADSGSFLERPLLADEEILGLNPPPDAAGTDPEADDPPDPPEAGSDPISLDFLLPSDAPDSLGRLGQYEVREVVGRGGMGVVLKANDSKLNRIVAVKVLAPELASNAAARKRFVREARAAAAVSHDHVVTIYAVEDDPLPYLAMEFIDGVSLQEKIDRQGQLSLREILRIGQQIAAGLAAAHGQGIIHRDVKPANILLQNGVERVKITDFGLARAVDDVEITRPGEVAGTPQFMSPEQAQGKPVDPRSDLFSLGSVLYTMCTGRAPFRADTTVAVLRRICDDTARPIREVNPDVPDWLAEIVERLLAKQPEDRFANAAEVAELLGRHLAHVQEPGSTPFPGRLSAAERRAVGRARRRRFWLAAALILLVLVGSLGISEATGVTRLAATVIRLATGQGTLVIEVDDPTVKVSIDGQDVRITGAGVGEVKLRPGQYRFKATRDGRPLKEELVTITRGGREAVRVALEPSPPASVDSVTMPSTDQEGVPSPGSREDQSEADWSKAIELAPDDPLLRIQRARWYAERGEQEKADADFAKAASLAPKAGTAIDVAEVRFALGQAYWDTNRLPEAHRTWQQALRDLHEPATENPEDSAIQNRVASCERGICHYYGSMGLWDFALPKHPASFRSSSYDPYVRLLALNGQEEAWREYCEYSVGQMSSHPSDVQIACLLEPPAMDVEACIASFQESVGNGSDNTMRFCLALAQCRTSRYEEAEKTIETHPPFQSLDSISGTGSKVMAAYLLAIAAQGAGHGEKAAGQIERAGRLHQMLCQAALTTNQRQLPGNFAGSWKTLVTVQVLRREAWQKIKGQSPPADPWWHLVQARGYALLGESERAEQEFAAAVAAAPDDPEIWIARSRVFEQLGDGARAEADRKKAIELGADMEPGGVPSPEQ